MSKLKKFAYDPKQRKLDFFNIKTSKPADEQPPQATSQLSMFTYVRPATINRAVPSSNRMDIENEPSSEQEPMQILSSKDKNPPSPKKKVWQRSEKHNKDTGRSQRNSSHTYETKYMVKKKLLDYIELKDDKTPVVKLCNDLGTQYNVKGQTVREWYYQVLKDRTVVDQAAEYCSNKLYANKKGHIKKKAYSVLACSEEIEQEIIDWIFFCQQVGMLLRPSQIKQKAKALNPDKTFKASRQWLKGFFFRHGLSLRATTTKVKRQESAEEKAFIQQFRDTVQDLITKYRILPRDLINVDETPMFWEYLPKRIVFKKNEKVVPSYKTANSYKRSTLLLACNAQGDLLPPALVLKRATPYQLQCQNRVNLLLQTTVNGWTTSISFIDWIEKVLAPYIQQRHCLLLLDSYEGHKSEQVRNFVLARYPNIHCCVIPGGYTDVLQPLDMGINSVFKNHCKNEALNFLNEAILKTYQQEQTDPIKKNYNLKIGTLIVLLLLYDIDEGDNWLIAEKDFIRGSRSKKENFINSKVEDVYRWIESSFYMLQRAPETIINCFSKAGFTNQPIIEEDLAVQNIIDDIVVDYSDVFEQPSGDLSMDEEHNAELKADDSIDEGMSNLYFLS